MPQIVAVRAKDDSSRDTITVVLSQDAVCLGPDGQPWAGVSLSASLARSLAERLLGLAKEVETEGKTDQGAFRSLAQATSILVLHEGSAQGHRAFSLALDLASRSLAAVSVVGIYGVRQDKFEPSTTADDYKWQREWLERLFQMYSREATMAGIDLRSTLVAANDQPNMSEFFDGNGFDLIVLPRRLSDMGGLDDASRKLHRQFAGATDSTILLCP